MKSLFLTEKISQQHPFATSMMLLRESVRRLSTFSFEPHELFLHNGKPKASAHKVTLNKKGELVVNEKAVVIDLANDCVINIRKDPPFDQSYTSLLYILALIKGNSYVTNNPLSVLKMPEKFIPAELQKFTPPTLISSDYARIKDFWDEHKTIVVKPLYEFGGSNVFKLTKGDENHHSILAIMKKTYSEPIIAQKYIPEIKKGDKRIIFIDGKPTFQLTRVPLDDMIQASVDLGGKYYKSELTRREKEICAALSKILIKNDIFLCGIDVINGNLTEINVTNTSLLHHINKSRENDKDYVPAEKIYWDRLETKLKKLK